MAVILLYSYSLLSFSPAPAASGLYHIGLSQWARCMIKCVYTYNHILWGFSRLSYSLIEFARVNTVYNNPIMWTPEHDSRFNTV